ncbi:MAG: hypothetical protein ACKV2T_00520 [Kofleriaceae bacterium]
MATTVTLHDDSGRTKVLTSVQTRLFLNELARVRGRWPWTFLKERLAEILASSRSGGPRLAPDCRIVVADSGTTDEFELLAESVLRRVGNRSSLQFYFGLLLLRWLDEP